MTIAPRYPRANFRLPSRYDCRRSTHCAPRFAPEAVIPEKSALTHVGHGYFDPSVGRVPIFEVFCREGSR
jgi:hypothetical protein